MIFNRKRTILKQIELSFGKIKTEGFNFDLIKRYFNKKDNSKAFQILSEQTCDDLDFDLFFSYVDRTSSRIGQQYLYSELRAIDYSESRAKQREKLIQYFTLNTKDRLNVQYLLKKLDEFQSYYCVDLFLSEPSKKPKWYFLIPMLSFCALFSLILSFFSPFFGFIFLGVFSANVIFHFGFKIKTSLFVNSVPTILSLGAIAKELYKYDELRIIDPNLQPSISVISSMRRKMSLFKLQQKLDSDMEAAYWFLLELFKMVFLLEPLLLFSSLDIFKNKSDEIEKVFRFVGEIDLIISIMALRNGVDNYCIPEISNQHHNMFFKDIVHPMVVNCVSNTIDFKKSILLTGSNMSGKTTFIRSIGLNLISGLNLNTCFASNAKFSVSKIFSVIRIEDDVTNSSSYFFQEVKEIKNIIEKTNENVFSYLLLDELFKGTNTIERIASAKAILSYLTKKNCQIFVSTHDVELTKLLSSEFELFHFSEKIEGTKIEFDFKIKAGIPLHGNAIRILEINGFPDTIIHEAKRLI